MLPKSLYSSYEQYKSDFDYIANWLATTARRCGYVDREAPPAAATKSTRLKGKARKFARESGSVSSASNSVQGPRYPVKIKDFIPLAESIANSTSPRVDVPSTFARRLRQAVQQVKLQQSASLGDLPSFLSWDGREVKTSVEVWSLNCRRLLEDLHNHLFLRVRDLLCGTASREFSKRWETDNKNQDQWVFSFHYWHYIANKLA